MWSSKLDKQEAIISGFCSARGPGHDKMVNAKLGMPSLLNLSLLPGGNPEAGNMRKGKEKLLEISEKRKYLLGLEHLMETSCRTEGGGL